MTAPDFLDPRLTEQRNPRTERIDVAATLEIVDLINAEDAMVPAAVRAVRAEIARAIDLDRKSTRLNSSHLVISYAVFCLKKKKKPPRPYVHPQSLEIRSVT